MSDPGVRIRSMVAAALLLTTAWGGISVLGRRSCDAFTLKETRELAGLPVPPACVQDRVGPLNPLDPPQNPVPGVTP